MTPDLWLLAVLCAATLGYVLHTMARIITVQREIAQMRREMRGR